MTAWQPTHVAPAGGTWVWAAPDAAAAPVEQLVAGTPVEIAEQHGSWTRVVCDNGFSGWVDGRLLVPRGAPPTSAAPAGGARSGFPIVAALVAVAVVVVVGALALGSGGDDAGDGDADGDAGDDVPATVAVGPVAVDLHVPAGWVLSDDGLVAAEDPADLTAAVPDGPVVRAEVGESSVPLDDPSNLDLRAGSADDFQFTDPEEQTVDGFPAVVLTVRGAGRVQAFVAVDPPGDDPVLFTIDCPADRFDELNQTVRSIPGLSR